MSDTGPTDWDHFGALVSPATIQCLQRSTSASRIRHYQVSLVPAMCQTADYTRALMTGTFECADEQVESFLDMRSRYRQVVEGCPRLQVVLDEAVVRRRIGGRDVMRGQVQELIALGQGPRLELRLVRFGSGAHVGLRGSFVHLTAADGSTDDLVYREVDGLNVARDGDHAARYVADFDRLWKLGLGGADLWDFLRGLW
jgi:hypothetical protein